MREFEKFLVGLFMVIAGVFILGLFGFAFIVICSHFGWFGVEYVSGEEVQRRWLESQ